ncbi:MAG TPA: CpaD family pilus assembly protein [Rhizomicrobium sp.]|jgi:pilus assembly protein CpaD
MTTKYILRFASLAAVLLAGSCAQPGDNDAPMASFQATQNYPITVVPGTQTIRVSYAGPGAGLSPDDSAAFDGFVAQYLAHGDGAISVSVPRGAGEQSEISYFGERLFAMGVDRGRILVGSRDIGNGDGRVEMSFVRYKAETRPCGDWSVNVADDSDNAPMPNFGCAVQHNIAAMVADPRDLVAPRPMGAANAQRRATVLTNYQKGVPTSAQQTSQQSGAVSDIDK